MTHAAALIATLTKPKAPPRKVATAGGCRANAPCGNRCCCDASVRHDLHCCKEPGYYCHTEARYREDKAKRKAHA